MSDYVQVQMLEALQEELRAMRSELVLIKTELTALRAAPAPEPAVAATPPAPVPMALSLARNAAERHARDLQTVQAVIAVVAESCRVPAWEILDRVRGSQELAVARILAMATVRRMTRLSWKEIGEAFGGRHHSTIVKGCARVPRADVDELVLCVTRRAGTEPESEEVKNDHDRGGLDGREKVGAQER